MPAFALNNLLSNVPLLGPLLTGGKNGGVFAISYRLDGPLDDLKTDVNMMAAMTPGALRELFSAAPDIASKAETPAARALDGLIWTRIRARLPSRVSDERSLRRRAPARGACGRPTA